MCVTLAVHAKKKVLGVNEPPSHLKQIYRSESQNLSIAKLLIRKFHSRFGYLIICPRSILQRSFLIKKCRKEKKWRISPNCAVSLFEDKTRFQLPGFLVITSMFTTTKTLEWNYWVKILDLNIALDYINLFVIWRKINWKRTEDVFKRKRADLSYHWNLRHHEKTVGLKFANNFWQVIDTKEPCYRN